MVPHSCITDSRTFRCQYASKPFVRVRDFDCTIYQSILFLSTAQSSHVYMRNLSGQSARINLKRELATNVGPEVANAVRVNGV